jgi:crotonobetainyl-CoA:carnitine CoA-transferase CaiB-like acyl-CoA transferase
LAAVNRALERLKRDSLAFTLNSRIAFLDSRRHVLCTTKRAQAQRSIVRKEPAKRAPEIGEHNEEVLQELGFDANEIDSLRSSGTIPGGGHLNSQLEMRNLR